MEKKPLCVLVNPNAGNGLALKSINIIEKTLESLKAPYRLWVTKNSDDSKKIVAKAILRGEHIVIAGGDGTICALANLITELEGVLGLIPLGRGNDFARSLGIPLEVKAATQLIVEGNIEKVDLGVANHQTFLTICSMGFDSLVNAIAKNTNWIKGPRVYLYAVLKALLSYKPTTFKVIVDGKMYEHEGYTVAVANSKCYGCGMFVAPDAKLNDGLLDIIMIGKMSKLHFIRQFPKVFKGSHMAEPEIKFLQGKHVIIEANPKYIAYADGELIGPSPVNISLQQKALKIIHRPITADQIEINIQ